MADTIPLAQRMAGIDASGIRKVFDLAAKMKDPINLSIGQPDFDVPDAAKDRAIAAIRGGRNKYTVTQGDAELRDAIARELRREFGRFDGPVLVTSGVSGGILLALMATVNAGDEVLVADPYFVMYKHLVNVLGARPVFVDTYPDFRLRADRLEAAVTPRTRMIILNSPCNPMGAVVPAEDLEAAVAVARRHNLLVLSDECYNAFTYDGPFASAWPLYDRIILLRGFSKTYAMTGWRLGYAVGPAEIVQAMTTLQQYTFVCGPAPLQAGAVAAYETDPADRIADFRERRDLIHEGLRERFRVTKPGGAFYIFPEAPGGSGTAFVSRAIEAGVLIIPGGVFSERDTHFRIAYAASRETIQRGLEALNRLARQMGA
ncbi:MAG: aminotransferase class I/II-fold pyridoxal phosphate-dependent enzyme [Planctomycetota bacterium]|nr:aminotransferase class I/II-fold pyridoxal phosphate-dependent enzyme [Planctomycetota bacterium]